MTTILQPTTGRGFRFLRPSSAPLHHPCHLSSAAAHLARSNQTPASTSCLSICPAGYNPSTIYSRRYYSVLSFMYLCHTQYLLAQPLTIATWQLHPPRMPIPMRLS